MIKVDYSLRKAYIELAFSPCLAGPAPASHPVKAVGTQRVAFDKPSMRLRVEARKDTENEYFDKYDSP